MTTVASFRSLVVARAGGACEYCRLLELATGMTFHVEQVVPRSQRGKTTMPNLALSCPGCNLAKGDRMTGEDHNRRFEPTHNFHSDQCSGRELRNRCGTINASSGPSFTRVAPKSLRLTAKGWFQGNVRWRQRSKNTGHQ